jgi:hypothetical protein
VTVSALDARTALVVVDLQQGTIGSNPMAHPAEDVIGHTAELAAEFRQRGLPVVLVNHAGNPAGRTQYGQGGSDWSPELTDLMPGLGAEASDLRVTKHSWGAFATTDLDASEHSCGPPGPHELRHRDDRRTGASARRHREQGQPAPVRHQRGAPGPDVRPPARRMLPLSTL